MQKDLVERDRCTSFRHHPHRTTTDCCDVDQVTIGILPDDILLCIFNAHVDGTYERDGWHTLVHVCQRWRTLVFGSPRHLNLQLFCSSRTPVKKMLDAWPALPIVVYYPYKDLDYQDQNMVNLIAAIKHNDRVCKIDFCTFHDVSQLEEVVSAMQVPFPALTDLEFVFVEEFETEVVIPDSFLDGSAPRLQRLHLAGISFPGLPKLLLSATDLVSLQLHLPHFWYISPDAMVTCLSASVRLKLFTLKFESRQDRDSRHLPPPTPTLLPALTSFRFQGVYEYAEDLMARIGAPLLHRLYITLFNETVPITPQLSQFINRIPSFRALNGARIAFSDDEVRITFPLPIRRIGYEGLVLGISWDNSVGQLSFLARLCRSFLPTLAMVEQLYIYGEGSLSPLHWPENILHSQWLELLHLFTGAKNLFLSDDLAPCISTILRQLAGERRTEVFPALENLFLHEYQQLWSVKEGFEAFVAARQLSGQPITLRSWTSELF